MDIFLALKQNLPSVQENVPLKNHTTFRIGGPARYFFAAQTEEDIQKAVQAAKELKLPFLILGGGSNILASDQGFSGLVIKIQNTEYKIPLDSARGRQDTTVYAQAGVPMATLVQETGKHGLSGLEWAGGLPGTVGGAIRGNAGAFEGETKDCVVEVKVLNEKGEVEVFSKEQCKFAYRSSLFKQKKFCGAFGNFEIERGR